VCGDQMQMWDSTKAMCEYGKNFCCEMNIAYLLYYCHLAFHFWHIAFIAFTLLSESSNSVPSKFTFQFNGTSKTWHRKYKAGNRGKIWHIPFRNFRYFSGVGIPWAIGSKSALHFRPKWLKNLALDYHLHVQWKK